MDQTFSDIYILFQEISSSSSSTSSWSSSSLRWVGFSVAAVQLVPYFYFSRQFTFELRKKKKKKKKKYRAANHAPNVDPNSSDCADDVCVSCKNLTRHCLCPITASTGNVLCRHPRICPPDR